MSEINHQLTQIDCNDENERERGRKSNRKSAHREQIK